MKQDVNKLYEQFTAKERLNLAIAALSRDDSAEFDRLYDSCTWKNYNHIDIDFSRKLENLRKIAALFVATCEKKLGEIIVYIQDRALEKISFELDYSIEMLEENNNNYDTLDNLKKCNEELRLITENKGVKLWEGYCYLKSICEALRLFCEEAKVNYSFFFSWVIKARGLCVIKNLEDDFYKIDDEIVKKFKADLLSLWE